LWERWDEVVTGAVFDTFETVFNEGKDIRGQPSALQGLPCVRSPAILVTWALVYLLVVGLGLLTITPADKGRRRAEPRYLKKLVKFHNVFLILLSSYMFVHTCYQAYINKYRFWGQAYDAREVGMARIIYIFYMSKLYEYFDTYIMLLKGNLKQVSFLHVYHHVTISFIWFFIAFAAPGGDAWYSAALNSLVHVAMYTYYYLASISSDNPGFRKRYLWWGRYLTSFQICQFVTMLAQGVYTWLYSDYPKWVSKFLVWYMVSLLALFGKFFAQKYLGQAQQHRRSKDE